MKINRIAIVGAGTAGWLAANHLGVHLEAEDITITVLESSVMPAIGVGEGTVPYVRKGLKKFGIDENKFLTLCDVTFKQGIKFVNWLDAVKHGQDNHYYHPFDPPYPGGLDVSNFWLAHGNERPFCDVGIQARISERKLAPKLGNSEQYKGGLEYAYHFDASKFAQLLSENAKKRFGVQHKVANIVNTQKDGNGYITHLFTDEGESLEFDFYVDCSGFSAALIDRALSIPFVDKSKFILTDTALVQQMPLCDESEINPYTTATAHKAGWIWDIPLTSRRGTGFVYSSKYIDAYEAKSLYANYLGLDIDSLDPKEIPMKVGYRERSWEKNCVALGLAQGFVEPLEATSILITDTCAELLARSFPRYKEEIDPIRTYFNESASYTWERVFDFIQMHYCISDRQDSQFWLDCKNNTLNSDVLENRLARFSYKVPDRLDFPSIYEMFNHHNYLYVLYGMRYKTRSVNMLASELKKGRDVFNGVDDLLEKASKSLMKHKEWLVKLKSKSV